VVVPADWKEVRLGEHAAFFKGNGLSKSQLIDDGPQQCVHYGELFTHYGPVIENVTSKCVAFEGSFKSLAGDVLMPGSDVTPRGLATASAIKVSDVVLGGDVIVIRTKPTSLYGPFLSNFIRMSKGRVLRLVKGSTVYHIHAKDLADLEVLMPPLKEQEAIAETLSDAGAAIESLDDLIAKKRDVKQAAMQQLLTGRTRLPGFTAEWKKVRFDEVFARVNISNRKLQTSEYSDIGRLPVMDQGQTRIAGFTDRQDIELIPPRDGFVIFGDHTRIVKHVRHPFVAGADGVQILRSCEGFNAEFLSLLLSSSRIPNTGYNRHFKFLKELIFKVPSDLVEQEAIAEALSVMGDELEALTAQVSKLRMVKEGMMQDLLTGKVRLV
jgi:type I restriction enzyme S subunit